MTRLALLTALSLAAAPAAAAGDVSATAQVSRNVVPLGEHFMLTVTVSGASLSDIPLPPMENFSVYSASHGNSFTFINGHMSSISEFTFDLVPRSVGKFKIPAIRIDGAAPTDAIDIEVVDGGRPAAAPAAPAAPGANTSVPRAGRPQALRLVAEVDKPKVYPNQQTTLSLRFLNAVPLMGNIGYNPPELTGVSFEELPPVRSGAATVEGRRFEVREIKLALFPTASGRLKIGAASVQAQVPRLGGGGGSIQDLFDGFMSAVEAVTVRSDPLFLQVEPLPPGRPEDFTGVVGKLSAKASVDRTSVKAGDAITLTVAVSGTGNLRSVPEPKKPDIPALRFFETESASTVDKSGDRVGGTKTFKTVVVPRASGRVRIPPFTFSYLDPETKTYARAQTAAIDLDVAPGAPGAAPYAPAAAGPTAPGVTAFGDDIRYLKTGPERAPISSALAAFGAAGPWHALPFAAFLAAAALAWRRRAAESDPRGRRAREALGRALARLGEASALADSEGARAAALSGEALAGYAADKLGVPAAGLTLKTALDGLRALPKAPSEESLGRLREAWEEADLRRFAPGAAGGDARRFAESTAALLKALDAEARR